MSEGVKSDEELKETIYDYCALAASKSSEFSKAYQVAPEPTGEWPFEALMIDYTTLTLE